MKARLFYLKLELKRAFRHFPQMAAGAAALVFLLGAAALLAGNILYGGAVSARISVGVVLPEDDQLAKKAISMVSSLESVKSLCDFSYMDRETGREMLSDGEIYALMEIPEGFVRDIMDGTNTPVTVMLPGNAGTESRIFTELTDAGAKILGSSQAGIYAGDELLMLYDQTESIARLEDDLNRIYLDYNLPRMDYFQKRMVSATGDVDTLTFYGISAFVLALLLGAIPVSGYLEPMGAVMRAKLKLEGIGRGTRAAARMLGLALLMVGVSVPMAVVAAWLGWLDVRAVGSGLPGLILVGFLVCLGAAAFCVCIFQLAGSLMGGVLLLSVTVAVMHFVSGGFVPLVFLPDRFKSLAVLMPSHILMDGVKMLVTGAWRTEAAGGLLGLIVVSFLICLMGEGSA